MNRTRNKQAINSREAGQGIVEYLLIIALVGLAVVVIINLMQPAIGAVFSDFVDRANTAPPNLVGFTRIPPTPTATPDPGATLTITIIGNGSVTQSPDPPLPGNTVTLTAVPDPGWVFAGWGDDLSGTDNPGFILLDTSKTVSANFVEETFILDVTLFGAGSVTVSPDQPSYTTGQTISLSAIPDTGSLFIAWGGDISGSTNPYILVMDSDKTVEAYFQTGCYDLNVTDSPNDAWGNVAVSPGPDCNGTQYNHGTVVSLLANPATGFVFNEWSGALSGSSNPTLLTMNGDRNVTANYLELLYTLTTSVAGNGTITVSPDLPTYGLGETATLTAVPGTGAIFTGWSGDASGTTNPFTITFDEDKTVTANFQNECYPLTLSEIPPSTGLITASPTSSPGCFAGFYNYGEVVTLTASPANGYRFINWTGAASGTNPTTSLTIQGATSATANFQAVCYTLVVTRNPTAGGLISIDPAPNCTTDAGGGGWLYLTDVTLSATASTGYAFDSWSGAITSTNNPQTVRVLGNTNVTANFVESSGDVLFVVGDPSLNLADTAVYNRLTSNFNYNVVVIDDSVSTTSDANGKSLVVISSTCLDSAVNTKFRDVAVPVILWEDRIYGDMLMASGRGTDNNEQEINIVNSAHPLAAGFSNGLVDVMNNDRTFNYATGLGSGGQGIATIDSNTSRYTIFAYNTGAARTNGSAAPARRVGLFFTDTVANNLNANGWAIFDAAVNWATGG